MAVINIELTNDTYVDTEIKEEELIYGATAIMINPTNSVFETTPPEGILPRVKAIHPITHDELDIIVTKEQDRYEDKATFVVPAHNQDHYNLAKYYNVPLKQVVAPYYLGEGEEECKNDLPIQTRRCVIVAIKHPTENKYLCLNNLESGNKSLVIGGVLTDEKIENAAIREVKEKTGYTDINITYTSPFEVHSQFYAKNKNMNRYLILNIIFGKLNSLLQEEIEERFKNVEEICWVETNKLREFVNIKTNFFVCDLILKGEHAYTGNGKIINSNNLDGFNRESGRVKAKEIISHF